MYTLWLWHSQFAMERSTHAIKNGMAHLFLYMGHGDFLWWTVSHNHRVIGISGCLMWILRIQTPIFWEGKYGHRNQIRPWRRIQSLKINWRHRNFQHRKVKSHLNSHELLFSIFLGRTTTTRAELVVLFFITPSLQRFPTETDSCAWARNNLNTSFGYSETTV